VLTSGCLTGQPSIKRNWVSAFSRWFRSAKVNTCQLKACFPADIVKSSLLGLLAKIKV
jgi:hypothetical protein